MSENQCWEVIKNGTKLTSGSLVVLFLCKIQPWNSRKQRWFTSVIETMVLKNLALIK
jgi:hypothetical protein